MKKQKLFLIILTVFVLNAGLDFVQKQTNKPASSGNELQTEKVLPHNSNSFTEGLFFYENRLYESSGLYGKSFVCISESAGSEALKQAELPSDVFGEGISVLDNVLYVLTWKEHKAYMMNPETLDVTGELSYEREGWGMTSDGESLIVSDGTDTIFFLDNELHTIDSIQVTENGNAVDNLNELEYIDGFIYANIWYTNDIVVIDTETGAVLYRIDCTPFLKDMTERNLYRISGQNYDVMNGIAYDENTDRLYLTGKNWKNLYQCTISETFRQEILQKKESLSRGDEHGKEF